MSLLDDVSIVVTPNGYKAGELYAVIPVPTEGSEEITNGDFATDTKWTTNTGWDISGGSANCDGSQTSNSTLIQQNGIKGATIDFVVGKRYKVNFDIVVTSGWIANIEVASGYDTTSIKTSSNHTTYIIAVSTNDRFTITVNPDFIGSIDNVSVKEYTSADMDVTRETAATRVDENGLVNYAEVVSDTELVTNGDFARDSDWNLGSSFSILGGLLTQNGTAGRAFQLITALEAGLGTYIKVTFTVEAISSGQFVVTCYGVSSPVVTTTGTYTFTGVTSDTTNLYVNNGGYYANGSISNISVKQSTVDNVPRIDYTGGGCPHILAEPMRTNLITYSEDLTNDFYQSTGIETVTESAIASPDGTSFGYTIVPTSATSSHYFEYNYSLVTVSVGVDVTYSIFIKRNGYNFIQIATSTGFEGKYQNFELTGDGVIGRGDVDGKTIEKIGDYYKISVTQISTGTHPRFLLIPSPTALATRNASFTGNGTDGVLGWGVQIEAGSYPTSYIPTSGSTVTRNQDIFTRDGIGSLINSEEGVLFVEAKAFENGSITVSNGTNNDNLMVSFNVNSGRLDVNMTVGGSYKFVFNYTTSVITNNKIAIKYKINDFALWVNGVEVLTDTSGDTAIANTYDRLNFSSANAASEFFKGEVKQLQVYDTALTDEQLLQLTGESGTDFYESYAEMASALNYTIQ